MLVVTNSSTSHLQYILFHRSEKLREEPFIDEMTATPLSRAKWFSEKGKYKSTVQTNIHVSDGSLSISWLFVPDYREYL